MKGAGKRNERVVIQQKTLSNDGWGAPSSESWATFDTVWAKVITARGVEFVSGSKDTAKRKIAVITEYTDGITEDMRVLWDGDYYEIVSITHHRQIENETQIDAIWTEGRA